MFMTGMGTTMSTFFQTTTMIISIPSVVILTCFIMSLYGGNIRFTTPMLFATAFLPMFAIGGLTGLPLGLTASDIYLHDTFYVIGHFHYVVAPGSLFALFAGIYYWYPKATGRQLSDKLGKLHFWLSFVAINFVFMPMFFQGMAGLSRRLYDPTVYAHGRGVQALNVVISWGAWGLAIAQLPYVVKPHPVTGLPNGKFGIWLFLASEVMLFGALFSSYVLIRIGAPHWPPEGGLSSEVLNVPLGTFNTAVLITSSITMVLAWASCKMGSLPRFKMWMGATVFLALVFLVVKYFEYSDKFHHDHFPSHDNFYAIYFLL